MGKLEQAKETERICMTIHTVRLDLYGCCSRWNPVSFPYQGLRKPIE